ncbi:GNAT family N-acetyltransferase [Chloroflexota bacterium]
MVKIRQISRSDVVKGMTGAGVYCLGRLPQSNWSDDPDERKLQQRRQALYLELIDLFGTCGLLALDENGVVGFITFFPKTIGRRLGFYTLPGNDELEKTLVVGCLHVAQAKRGHGIGSTLIQGVKDWAARGGYSTVEAIGEGEPQYGWHASAPFLPLGFEVLREKRHGSWCGQMMKCVLEASAD